MGETASAMLQSLSGYTAELVRHVALITEKCLSVRQSCVQACEKIETDRAGHYLHAVAF